MAEKMMILLGCDCDPDRLQYGGARYDVHRAHQEWRGLVEGVALLQQRLKRIADDTGISPKVVFCLRSDSQMKEIYGSESWPIEQHMSMWKRLEAEGHELAWHPHLWRWSSEWNCWMQEIKDSKWISECLEMGFSGFSRTLGKSPTTCHMGWTFQNNTTMKKIAELGVPMDFSASPGVYFEGGQGSAGTTFDNRIDWLGTPRAWYHPSEADYRRPPTGGENGLPITEIPKFTSQSGILKKAKTLSSRAGKTTGSKTGTDVFLQATILPMLYRRIIKERLQCTEAEPFFATYFHPDELLPDRPRSAKMFLYSLDNLEKNLKGIIEASRKRGRDVTFVTGAEALRYIQEKRNHQESSEEHIT